MSDKSKDKLIKKKSIKEKITALEKKLSGQQQLIKETKLPVLVLFEGAAAAGKGKVISDVIKELDPRYYDVKTVKFGKEANEKYPFLHRYFSVIPENGQIKLLDSGWMQEIVEERLHREITEKEYKGRITTINRFERQLRDNGYVVIKFFIDISEDEQWRRMTKLMENIDTSWRVDENDIWQHEHYNEMYDAYSEFMDATSEPAPWYRLNGDDKLESRYTALKVITDVIEKAVENGKYCGKPFNEKFRMVKMPKLAEIDINVSIEEDKYKSELKKLQDKLSVLHDKVYRKRIPVVICYEGWDASGKGGNIRRISKALDPRGYEVHPIASPEPHELARHYLWRFWTRIPSAGHIAIFDRTWYGRVMVERIEGFCSERDWKRAYNEINEFESELVDWGVVVIKFWLHIDSDTQLARFNDRQNTPSKQWKITDEDWRNREKWSLYEPAADEMIEKTSTVVAPWHIIESTDKKYARIKTLRIIVEALEKALASNIVRGTNYGCLEAKEKKENGAKATEKLKKKMSNTEKLAAVEESQTAEKPFMPEQTENLMPEGLQVTEKLSKTEKIPVIEESLTLKQTEKKEQK